MNPEEYFQQLESTSTALFDVALGRDSTEERYTEMNEVGRGATKHIYKVLDLSSGRTVALALPNEDLPVFANNDNPVLVWVYVVNSMPLKCCDLLTVCNWANRKFALRTVPPSNPARACSFYIKSSG